VRSALRNRGIDVAIVNDVTRYSNWLRESSASICRVAPGVHCAARVFSAGARGSNERDGAQLEVRCAFAMAVTLRTQSAGLGLATA
jgi:hypothetical protein